jgi:hypothetical protein
LFSAWTAFWKGRAVLAAPGLAVVEPLVKDDFRVQGVVEALL